MEEIRDDDYKHRSQLDQVELAQLVERYWQDVWQYAYFLTKREHLAEDVAQDTFIKAMQGIDAYRGDGPLRNWLFRIARNTAFNYRKSAFWRKVALVGLSPAASGSPSAESDYWQGEFANEVWAAVWELPSKYREPLILYAHYEWSYREMAELLGIAEGTVKSRLHRGRELLAKRMKEADIDGQRQPDRG